jgi:hypothetical protein
MLALILVAAAGPPLVVRDPRPLGYDHLGGQLPMHPLRWEAEAATGHRPDRRVHLPGSG